MRFYGQIKNPRFYGAGFKFPTFFKTGLAATSCYRAR